MKIGIPELIINDSWNIRANSLCKGRIAEYADHLEDLPPIRVARLDGGLYLVDGWHRVTAARVRGMSEIEAEVDEKLTTESEARIAAFKANIKHGLFLDNKQKREWFNAIKDLRPDWSTREWGKELGVNHSTIVRWDTGANAPVDALPQRASAADRAGVTTIDAILRDWSRYQATELRRFPVAKWSPEYRLRVKAMLKPLVEFYDQLA